MQASWMTRDEARSLERARDSGFLVHRQEQKCLAEEWSEWCQRTGRPCLRVERRGKKAQLLLSTARGAQVLSEDQQRLIRDFLSRQGGLAPGAVWPIVHRYGAYSQPLETGVAAAAAQGLSRLLVP